MVIELPGNVIGKVLGKCKIARTLHSDRYRKRNKICPFDDTLCIWLGSVWCQTAFEVLFWSHSNPQVAVLMRQRWRGSSLADWFHQSCLLYVVSFLEEDNRWGSLSCGGISVSVRNFHHRFSMISSMQNRTHNYILWMFREYHLRSACFALIWKLGAEFRDIVRHQWWEGMAL